MQWNSNTGTEDNSRFINVWMKNLVHESWKRQRDYIAHEPKQPAFLNMTVKLLTYWWWFERVFLREIYSHLPHATLVRCCAHKHRQMSHFSLLADVVFHPSFMPTDVKCHKGLICPLPETHFSCATFSGFYAVMYFSPGEFSSKSLHIIRRHQRVTEWDCVNVWPRIAVCVTGTVCADFRLKAGAVGWGAACQGRTEEK